MIQIFLKFNIILINLYQVRIKTESTTFLGALWALSAETAPRKAVDPGQIILLTVLSNFQANIFKKCQN